MNRSADATFVALLRGVNLGGRNRVAMRDLEAIALDLGWREVKSYIQSGNLVFRAAGTEAGLAEALRAALAKRAGLAVPVLVRSAGRLEAALKANPFIKAGADPAVLHLGFFSRVPEPAAVKALAPPAAPGEELRILGDHVYLRLPHGMARTKLTNAYFDRKLDGVLTVRNWATALALRDLARG